MNIERGESSITSYREDRAGAIRERWIKRSREHFESARDSLGLSFLGDDACIVLHGSTSRNVDDGFSDLDFYLILDEESADRFDAHFDSRFVDVTIHEKIGHLNVVTTAAIDAAFVRPDLETIYELQHAVAVFDPRDSFEPIRVKAARPMSAEVRRAALLYNYIETRSFFRSAVNPINRHDRLAALSCVIEAIHYAVRTARVIDGLTYPYSKWLHAAARSSPTAHLLVDSIEQILDHIQSNSLALAGPSDENVILALLRSQRLQLIEGANRIGIDEDWLRHWWLHFDAQRHAFDNVEW